MITLLQQNNQNLLEIDFCDGYHTYQNLIIVLNYLSHKESSCGYAFTSFFINSVQIDLPSSDVLKLAKREGDKWLAIIHKLEHPFNSKQTSPHSLSNGWLVHSADFHSGERYKKMLCIVVLIKYKSYTPTANHFSHFEFLKTYNAIIVYRTYTLKNKEWK